MCRPTFLRLSRIVNNMGPRHLGHYANNCRILKLEDTQRGPASHQRPPSGRNVNSGALNLRVCPTSAAGRLGLGLGLAAVASDWPPTAPCSASNFSSAESRSAIPGIHLWALQGWGTHFLTRPCPPWSGTVKYKVLPHMEVSASL